MKDSGTQAVQPLVFSCLVQLAQLQVRKLKLSDFCFAGIFQTERTQTFPPFITVTAPL